MEIHIWIEIQPQINTTRMDVSANMIGTLVSTRPEASVFLGGGFSACLLDKTYLTLVRMRGLIFFALQIQYSYNHKTIQAQGHPTNYEISSSENAAWGKLWKSIQVKPTWGFSGYWASPTPWLQEGNFEHCREQSHFAAQIVFEKERKWERAAPAFPTTQHSPHWRFQLPRLMQNI